MKAKTIVRALAAAGIVTLGGTTLPALAQQPQKVEKIEVTGSSIKRIEGETALPVTVITREEIEKSGVTSAADFMDRMTVNNGQGYNTSIALGDAARPGFAGASLRGLGSNNTLVLLNGRRMAVYAFDGGGVNLNSIPFAAIERVEILRDGASAVYGTDAIGGVINFITRKDYSGIEVSANASQPRATGGGETKGYAATFGFGDLAKHRFNVMGTVQSFDQTHLFAGDRWFANTVRRGDLFNAFRFSSNSFPSAVVLSTGALASPAGPLYSAQTGLKCIPPASFGQNDSDNRCRYDYVSQIDILPDVERKSFLGRATLQISADAQAYAEYTYSENKYTFRVSQTPVSAGTTLNGDDVFLPPTSQYYPTAWLQQVDPDSVGKPISLFYRAIEAGPRTNQTKEKQDRFVTGIDGVLGKWDYSAAFSKAKNRADDYYVAGYLLESRTIPAFATGLINPFAPNTGTGLQTLLDTQFIGLTRTSKSERNSLDVKGSTELMALANGPLAIAVGAELSRFKFNDNPLPVLNSGDIIGGAGEQKPVNAERDVDALFTELSIPLAKSLEAQVALRHDRYSDFGSTTNPKVALRWQPNAAFLVRAAAGKGFRAPTLPDMFAPVAQGITAGVYDDPLYDSSQPGVPSRCAVQFNPLYCTAQLTAKTGGNPALQPEKSSQWTLGVLFEPTRNVSVSLDYWVINQRDLIGIISSDTKLADYIANFNAATRTSSSIYASDVVAQTSTQTGGTVIDYVNSVFQNLGRKVTKGVDVSVKSKLGTTPFGAWRLNFEATYIDETSTKLPGQDDYVNAAGQYAAFGPVSRFKHQTSLVWDWKSWNTALTYNFTLGYLDENGPTSISPNHRVGNYETWDLATTYSGVKNLRMTLGLRNIFDRDPPASNQNFYFHIGYDPTYTDPRGRTLYGNVSYAFK